MAHPEGLAQWTATVAKELTPLSPAQARVLALWSYGMVLTQSCACHTIAVFLGLCSGEGYHALRQRLREWCDDASDFPGARAGRGGRGWRGYRRHSPRHARERRAMVAVRMARGQSVCAINR